MIKDSKEVLATLGQTLKKYREQAKLSQDKLAAKCDTEQADISRIEAGLLNPGVLVIVDLARGLGITPATLLEEIQ
ncbi:helix-turn-helix transcriptional regulator [Chitinophaga oryzae]|uniref:Helix-turn-helix transcriptional regulator n=1 Tax=Chitinophaga oryzae TaxID=2725414 RepID=A0ABX6LNU9_9BACT|nr:helix-turn-helix transcriptional regulator [Chitinophaga oryzae]QJB41722.1 helix-turn-helix transcriptional regulator [Chitinophaga oryzae]